MNGDRRRGRRALLSASGMSQAFGSCQKGGSPHAFLYPQGQVTWYRHRAWRLGMKQPYKAAFKLKLQMWISLQAYNAQVKHSETFDRSRKKLNIS